MEVPIARLFRSSHFVSLDGIGIIGTERTGTDAVDVSLGSALTLSSKPEEDDTFRKGSDKCSTRY